MYHCTRRTVYVVLLIAAICGAILVNPVGNTTASHPQSPRQKPTASVSLPGQPESTNQSQGSIWPSVEKQLINARAPKGSALEALIRANQDFSLLTPDEATDTIRVPAWLRVFWRKARPDYVRKPNDPTKGYPFVLKEIYEWMVTHPDLQPGTPEPPVAPSDEVRVPVIGTDKRVSGSQSVPQSESDIRINYWDPSKIISASNNIGGSGMQSQYYSTNSGSTWGRTNLSLFSGDSFHSDPTVDWTSDGRAWSTTLGISGGTLRGRSYVSTNNGVTWTQDGTFSGTQTNVDKQMVWVDHSSSSSFKDNIYAIWHNGAPVYMSRRLSSWSSPIQVSGSETTGTGIGSDVKTNAFGDVFGFWPDTGSRGIYLVKSTNGGSSYGSPIQIATTFDSFDIGVPSFNNRRVLIYVTAGAYRTAVKNNVYAIWADLDASGSEPGSNASSPRKTRIWFSRSTNGGTSWSAKAMINNQAGLNDQHNPWMVVDETSGALGVIYYDTVGDSTRRTVNVWYQASYDDGVTWEVPVKVTTAVTDETISGADSGNQFGDYNGLSGFAGKFFPSWTDRRSGGREEIWTAEITDNAVPSPSVIAAGSSITNGNCGSPATTAIDPGETVTVSFSLQNVGSANTGANTTATLRSTGGVTLPSAAQNYGQLTSGGGAVSRSFTFTANGNCGDTITATFDVTDGTYTTTVTYQFVLGGGALNTIFSQNFDGVTAPALPSGWTTSVLSGSVGSWASTTTNPDTAANTTFTNGITTVASNALISPSIALPAGSTGVTLSFRHAWNFESPWDGGVLEISTNAGSTWTDAVTLGATFDQGGYTGALNSSGNPLSTRQAWTGAQTGYVTTTATLPASLNGQSIQLRWRGGWDASVANTNPNWRVDTVSIATPACSSCSGGCPTISGTVSGTTTICSGNSTNVSVTVSGGTSPYTVTISNGGGTQNGSGPTFNFSVSPTTSTTYLVSGTDANNCTISGIGNAVVTVNQPPAGANAGLDQTICTGGAAALNASQTSGTGVWSVFNGPNTSTSQFSNTTVSNAVFTPTTTGTYTLRWTVTNSPCVGSVTDDVVVTVNAGPPTAEAGSNQTLCFPTTTTLGANSPSPGTGAWTVLVGPNTSLSQFSNPTSPTSTFTPTASGQYTLQWTISQSPCVPTSDVIALNYVAPPSTANAGPDRQTCAGVPVGLSATNPTSGSGMWSVVSGPSTSSSQFSIVTGFNATFTPAGGAGTYLLQWTVSNSPCSTSSDQMIVDVVASCASGSATLYVADTTNNRVQKFNGTTWTVIGTGVSGTGNGQFLTPEAVTASLDGVRIYVADTGNNRIQWSTNSGATWFNFATSGTGLNQVSGPRGLALDSAGNLYVADGGNNRVLRFNDGTPGTGVLLAASGTTSGRVRTPNGLAVDSNFNLFIADTLNNRILKVTNANTRTNANTGTVLAGLSSGLTGVRAPQGLAVDSANNLYVADTGNNRVIRFAGGTSGTATALCLSGTTLGKVRAPEGVTISVFTAGSLTGGEFLVVSDTTNNRIQGKLLSGTTWTLVGTPNGLGSGIGQFRAPSKIR
ncbi:MAG: SMP-30/gluconolactonase/LRE family protein [Acidobacteria bacterium]|nr:SMP-30/gluconolactonase/LRE family protein [Acidobacteriota bacterium]